MVRYQTPSSVLGLKIHGRTRRSSPVRACGFRRRLALSAIFMFAVCFTMVVLQSDIFGGKPPNPPTKVRRRNALKQRRAKAGIFSKEKTWQMHGLFKKRIVVILHNMMESELCANTLIAAKEMAFFPSRISFRLVEELYIGKEDSCVQQYCRAKPAECREMIQSGKLNYILRDASGASGMSVARHLAEQLVELQQFDLDDFYLSIEEPSILFTKEWDFEMIYEWHRTGNDRAILSIAPQHYLLQNHNPPAILMTCSARIHSRAKDGLVEINPPEPVKKKKAVEFPILQSLYSEKFHFGRLSALVIVPSDPYVPHLWEGHEYTRATRFWTHGFDFYAPSRDILFAGYKQPKVKELMASSVRRMRRLLGLPVTFDGEPLAEAKRYGLGTKRSFERWKTFSKIDPRANFNESTRNQFSTCDEELHYVAYFD